MSAMSVLVACEFSGVVRDAFNAVGCDAWSCDLLPSEGRAGNHLVGDVRWALEGRLDKYPQAYDVRNGRQAVYRKWDLLIAHPPCTFLANSGVRWLYLDGRKENGIDQAREWDMEAACDFYLTLWQSEAANAIPRIAIENPIMHCFARDYMNKCGPLPEPQYIQPWMFGHTEVKATGLRLKNLPRLVETSNVKAQMAGMARKETDRVHYASPGADRWKERSRTLPGIAAAMASQWGNWQSP